MESSKSEHNQSLRFEIFQDEAALFKWDNHLRYAQEQKLYPPDLTKQYIEALTLLRQVLGESFLRQVGYAHPLAKMILETSSWQVQRLCDYTDQLRYLSAKDPNFGNLRQKLLSPAYAQREIMPFLQISHILRSTGMGLCFPAEKTGQKNPDILIIDPNSGQVLYGEVSRLSKSQSHEESERNFYRLRHVLTDHLTNPLFSAVQFQPMPEDYQAALGPFVTALQRHVAATNLPAEYTDAYFTIKLFPLSQQEALYTWIEAADRRKDLIGPPQNFDETQRISGNKIARKSKQLPSDAPGMLFIPLESIHFWQQKVTATTTIFQQKMRKLRRVFGVFLFAESLHVGAEEFKFNPDDGFDRTVIAGPLVRYSLFVPNPDFSQPIDPKTRKTLLSMFAPRFPDLENL